jgi:hypothetical protein
MSQVTGQPARFLLLALLLAIPFSAFPQEPPLPAQKWRQSQKTDPLRGFAYTQFTLAGKFLKWPERDASNRPTLEVDCRTSERSSGSKGKFWHAYFLTGTPLTIEYVEPDEIKAGIMYYPKVSVRYRLDDGKERKEEWSPGADKTSVSIPKDALKRMLGAHTVLIIVNENNAAEVSAQFEVPDSAEVARACNIGYHKK